MRVSIELEVQWPRRLRSPRRRLVAVALLVALAVPGAALASHFSDVPDGHPFHGDIARVAGSAITVGCGGGNFCPEANVTRGQMAAFLNRGLGRVARTNLLGTATTSAAINIGSVTIQAGNTTGGYAYVWVSASVNAYAIAAGCYCEATTLVLRNNTVQTQEMYMDLPAVNSPTDGDTDEVAVTQNVVVIPTGTPQTFTARFQRTVGSATVYAFGTLVAMVIPFDGEGLPPNFGAGAVAPESVVGKTEE